MGSGPKSWYRAARTVCHPADMQTLDHVPVRLARIAAPLLIATALVLPAAAPVAAAEPDWPASNSGYHNWPELVAEIQQAAVDYPSIVSVFSIGKSSRGLDIWMAKVSDNVAEDEAEPEVLVDALHHAREHLTTEQALALLGWLTRDYGADETVTRLVDTREVFIIFALNPDGMRYDLTGTPYRAWRKNLQRDAAGSAMYTDLNRNYGYRWGCCGGSSGKRSANTYRGPAAFSAPETRALRDFVNGRVVDGVQQIRTHVTLHTNGQLILWPYGYTKTNIPSDMSALDHAALVALGRAMAARNGYTAKQSSDLYVTDGDQIDWMYGRHRIFSLHLRAVPDGEGDGLGGPLPRRLVHRCPDRAEPEGAAPPHRPCGLPLRRPGRAGPPRPTAGPCSTTSRSTGAGSATPRARTPRPRAVGPSANPQPTSSGGAKQLGRTVSGIRALVTGAAAGSSAGANDVDGGTTTIRSRVIRLPEDPAAFGNLTFSWVFAHSAELVRQGRAPGPGGDRGREPDGRVRGSRAAGERQRLLADRQRLARGVGRPADPPRDGGHRRRQGQPGRGGDRRHPHPPALTRPRNKRVPSTRVTWLAGNPAAAARRPPASGAFADIAGGDRLRICGDPTDPRAPGGRPPGDPRRRRVPPSGRLPTWPWRAARGRSMRPARPSRCRRAGWTSWSATCSSPARPRACACWTRSPADGPAVLLLSSFDQPPLIRSAFERGAAGYLIKTSEVGEILDAIRTVASGGTAFSAAMLRAIRSAPRRPSDRELEVLALLCGGASNDEIGVRLGVTEKTVESHLRRLFDRYGVLSRTELAVLALREGWVAEKGRA